MCKDCVTKYCTNDKNHHTNGNKDGYNCSVCDKGFEKKDMINLKESGSAFASHSKVEATIYKPHF